MSTKLHISVHIVWAKLDLNFVISTSNRELKISFLKLCLFVLISLSVLIMSSLWALIATIFIAIAVLQWPCLKKLDAGINSLPFQFFLEDTCTFSTFETLWFIFQIEYLIGHQLVSEMSAYHFVSSIRVSGVVLWQSLCPVRFQAGLYARLLAWNIPILKENYIVSTLATATSPDLNLAVQAESTLLPRFVPISNDLLTSKTFPI